MIGEKICVKTPSGARIIGLDNGRARCFLGIRYARAERFCLPNIEPLPSVDTQAIEMGDCCVQERQFFDEAKKKNTLWYEEFRKGESFTYSEDCLNLNIYSPQNAQNCPVLVFVHGGAFVKGSNSEKPFDGSQYARRGIVAVFINYRLNAFGFYADKNVANLALYDIKTALEWVRQNIGVFGGDKSKITLMGQSAGAISVQCLILNPEIKRIVSGAVMISGGGALKGIYAPHSLAWAKRFFGYLNAKIDKLGGKNASSKDVFMAYRELAQKHPIIAMLACMPAFDGNLVDKKNYADCDKNPQIACLIGTTKDDMQPRRLLRKYVKNYAEKCAANVWTYRFWHNLPDDDRGAWHSSDLWYVFGSFDRCWRNFKEDDFRISNEIIGHICAFACAQNPNADGLPLWNIGEDRVFE